MFRSLVKAYGLKFIISVSGKAGKFDFVPLIIRLGAGVGILSVAKLVADLILLTCTSKKELYRGFKQLYLKQEDKNPVLGDEADLKEVCCI
jgi:P2X purinoceptor 4